MAQSNDERIISNRGEFKLLDSFEFDGGSWTAAYYDEHYDEYHVISGHGNDLSVVSSHYIPSTKKEAIEMAERWLEPSDELMDREHKNWEIIESYPLEDKGEFKILLGENYHGEEFYYIGRYEKGKYFSYIDGKFSHLDDAEDEVEDLLNYYS